MSLPLPLHRTEEIAQARSHAICAVNARDWYRLGGLFTTGLRLFGHGWYNDHGRTRLAIERQMDHNCRVWREKYPGTCTPDREKVCTQIYEAAFRAVDKRPRGVGPVPYLIGILRRTINDEAVHAKLKATVAQFSPNSHIFTVFRTME